VLFKSGIKDDKKEQSLLILNDDTHVIDTFGECVEKAQQKLKVKYTSK